MLTAVLIYVAAGFVLSAGQLLYELVTGDAVASDVSLQAVILTAAFWPVFGLARFIRALKH